jgi:hypothetical protein
MLTWQTHEHEKGLEADNHQKRRCLNGFGFVGQLPLPYL